MSYGSCIANTNERTYCIDVGYIELKMYSNVNYPSVENSATVCTLTMPVPSLDKGGGQH